MSFYETVAKNVRQKHEEEMNNAQIDTTDGPLRTWRHPTGETPNTVLVVALGPTKQDLLELTTAHEPNPILMDADEVWGLNGGVNHFAGRVRYDMLWIMDHIDGEARKEPMYGRHIQDWMVRHGFPVITSQARGDWGLDDRVFEYPIQEIVQAFGAENAYFHNSIPYVIAYALFIGVKRLVLFGADYAHERSKRREDDRPNAEYWVGFARARGMEVHLPDTTTLCNASRGTWFYGYQDQPVHLIRKPGKESSG